MVDLWLQPELTTFSRYGDSPTHVRTERGQLIEQYWTEDHAYVCLHAERLLCDGAYVVSGDITPFLLW